MVTVLELNSACRGSIFKSVLLDIIYSFRMSIRKLTGFNSDIKLDKISIKPMNTTYKAYTRKITNIIGGKIGCSIDSALINFLKDNTGFTKTTTPLIFVTDFFDCFECTSRHHWLTFESSNNLKEVEAYNKDGSYYIRFIVKIITENKEVILSKFIVIIDEIASLYFI